MKEFSKSNLLSRAIEIRPKNELVGHLSELTPYLSDRELFVSIKDKFELSPSFVGTRKDKFTYSPPGRGISYLITKLP